MSIDASARLIDLPDRPGPRVDESAFVAAGAVLVGNVSLAEHASVWYNAVLRAEAEPIRIGQAHVARARTCRTTSPATSTPASR
jgi:carbonic anhydrase/acetyltransferase-like protein (isoleucine patch superfamily)